MSIKNATPRPWKKNNTYGWLEGANGNLVSTYDLGLSAALAGPSEEERANAKLIVTAVNAYDPMKDALDNAKAALNKIRSCSIAGAEKGYTNPEDWGRELFESHSDVAFALDKIDAALRLAKGE